MKNAGVGVGIPDWGRCKLIVEADEKVHIYSGASCIGQGLGTVLVQVVVTNTGLHRDNIVYERSNTWIAPDSGDTSGSRQTLVTGEATRRACEKLSAALAGKTLHDLVGQEFYGQNGPPGGRCAKPRQPCGLRLCHADVYSGPGDGPCQKDGGRPRCG
jgi:aldehyde oxidoreductase